jgi:hypothetical protein
MGCSYWMIPVLYRGPCANAAVMSDLLFRRVSEGRVGVEAPDDYDVIGADGSVIGRIFKTAIPGTGTSWAWRLTCGEREDHGYEPTREAAMAAFAKSWRKN